MPQAAAINSQRTIADYERSARDYVETVGGKSSASDEALQQFAAAVTPGSRVLDVGSGPGWDADRLEALGVDVHRTDAAVAFCGFQAGRGKQCDRLDVLSDGIEGRYGGITMLCVLQHFERPELDVALLKLATALQPGGPMLLMYPEGDDERREQGTDGDYRVVRWMPSAFDARLAQAGFAVAWESTRQGRGGVWRTVLAQRATWIVPSP